MKKTNKLGSANQEVLVAKEPNKIYVYKIRKQLLAPIPYVWKINLAEIKKLKALLN